MNAEKFLGTLSSMGGAVILVGGDLHFSGSVEVVRMAREAVEKYPSMAASLLQHKTPSAETDRQARVERLRAVGISSPKTLMAKDKEALPDSVAPITAVVLEVESCACGRQALLYRQGKRSRVVCPTCGVITEWSMDETAAIKAWRRSRQE